MAEQKIDRESARAILLNPKNEIFLIQIELEKGNFSWITPGGKVESGEDHITAVARELQEEIGLGGVTVGELVSVQDEMVDWMRRGVLILVRDSFYVVRLEEEKNFRFGDLTEDEKSVFRNMKWWCLDDIKSSNETFFPSNLAEILENLIVDKN